MTTWGDPASAARGCGARAAVVDDGGDPLEERLLVDLPDGQAVRSVIHERQIGPPAKHDRAASCRPGGPDEMLAEILWSADTAEAQVDRWIAGFEECFQLRGQRTLVR